MTTSRAHIKPEMLNPFLNRLLNPSASGDYLWAFWIGGWPILCASLIGAHSDFEDYAGYWGRYNWTLHALLLPFALFLLRWALNKIAPVRRSSPEDRVPSVIELIKSPEGQLEAYQDLCSTILSSRNVMFAVGVTVLFHVFDMWEIIQIYLNLIDTNIEEKDWTVMFLTEQVGVWQNAVLVISAYASQFSLVLIMVLFATLVTRHNLFFLGRVYQRRWVPNDKARAYIIIDLDDVNNCFGFRAANRAFNVQILLLALAGAGLLVSRFANVIPSRSLFPDAGQILMTALWFGGLLVVSLPVWVKLLPRIPGGGDLPELSIVNYLREFFPRQQWPYGDSPGKEVVNVLCARFASNAFWPTGNNRAITLFFFSFLVACFLIIPDLGLILSTFETVPTGLQNNWVVIIGSLIIYATVAYALTSLFMWLLKIMLRYIDERLVQPPEGSIMTIAELNAGLGVSSNVADIGVFISYRRIDSSAYTGRLKEHLERRVDKRRIFYDLHGVKAGSDFVEEIDRAIDDSDVMLVMIGPYWLAQKDENGLMKPGGLRGWVVYEIAAALRSNISVIPVLVGGAEMPAADQLPEEIVELSRRQAQEISDKRWSYDMEELITAVLRIGDQH